jgi:bacteriorhodopsin
MALTSKGLKGTLPWDQGSVDGGDSHGFATLGGALGTPLLIGTICMFATSVYFIVQSYRVPKEVRKYQYVSLSVTLIATVAYLCMRANIGVIQVECAKGACDIQGLTSSNAIQTHGGKTYPLFWMRYIDWFFTTPFFLLDLCLLAGANNFDTFYVMLQNAICITAGAIGSLKPSVNIPFFVIGMVTFVAFIHKLLGLGDAKDIGEARVAHYKKVMMITMGIWCAYPVMFLLCEMTKTVPTDIEVWLYMILDVSAKCGCGILLVSSHCDGK